jgi:hypothetical protein
MARLFRVRSARPKRRGPLSPPWARMGSESAALRAGRLARPAMCSPTGGLSAPVVCYAQKPVIGARLAGAPSRVHNLARGHNLKGGQHKHRDPPSGPDRACRLSGAGAPWRHRVICRRRRGACRPRRPRPMRRGGDPLPLRGIRAARANRDCRRRSLPSPSGRGLQRSQHPAREGLPLPAYVSV